MTGTPISVAPSRDGTSDRFDMWFEHMDDCRPHPYAVWVFGTGHPVPWTQQTGHAWKLLGTVVTPIGLVWHVYTGPRKGDAIAVLGPDGLAFDEVTGPTPSDSPDSPTAVDKGMEGERDDIGMDDANSAFRDTLTIWTPTISAQIRDYTPSTMLALAIRDDAPRSPENGHPVLLPLAEVVLLRDLLNAATERGYLPPDTQPSSADLAADDD